MADILVLGANGYSGRLTARYLLEHPQRNAFTLALAGRTRDKVEGCGLPLDQSVRIWEVDVAQPETIEAAVSQVSVVINCVGPFWRHGSNVVAACVKHGKHYVDITGEVPYIWDLINLFDFQASQMQSVVIPACSNDCVPSDAVVYHANKTLKARHPNAEIEDSVTAVELSSGIGAGTFQTAFAMLEEVPKNVLHFTQLPYSLSPLHGGPPHPRFRWLYRLPPPLSSITGGYFFLGSANRAVVERTFGLQQFQLATGTRARDPLLAYGPRFRYDEFQQTRTTLGALLLSAAVAFAGISLMLFPPVRWLAKRLVPASGQGPPQSTVKKGYLEMTNITTAVVPNEPKPVLVRTVLRSDVSPLYLSSVIVAEGALALLTPADLPALAREGGVLTPMSGLGDALIKRLEDTCMFTFSSEFIGEEESAKAK